MLFCTLALIAAAVCVRLGLWQLARHQEKVRRNEVIAARQRSAPVDLVAVTRDTGEARFRPAIVTGRFDYDQELVLSGRTHQGSPGVELLTPVRIAGWDTAVLVDRGWVYSPNGAFVDRARWREADSGTVRGYVELYMPDAGTTTAADPRTVRRVSRREIAARIPYPVAPYYLVATGDSADGDHPARRALPALDAGPHRSYAIQWFAFALFAVAGAVLVVLRERRGT